VTTANVNLVYDVYNVASWYKPIGGDREYARWSKFSYLYDKYRVLSARVTVFAANASSKSFMFCLNNSGTAVISPVGPSIDLFENACSTNKKYIGSSSGGQASFKTTRSYNIPSILTKETDPISARLSCPMGENPGANESVNVAVTMFHMDAFDQFYAEYMIQIDAVVLLTDLKEEA
jgi:hypothetical protein